MKVHILCYTNTKLGFDTSSVEVYLTHKEAANAMVESVRGIYPNYRCVDCENGDETNIDALRVGTYYAYDLGYENNWVILQTELPSSMFLYGVVLKAFRHQYANLEVSDEAILTLIKKYDKDMSHIETLVNNGTSLENIVFDMVGSTLYHEVLDKLEYSEDDLDEVVDWLNTDEFHHDSESWMKAMLSAMMGNTDTIKEMQKALDEHLNPYKGLVPDNFRELCSYLDDDSYGCLLKEIKKAKEATTSAEYTHMAAYQNTMLIIRKRFFEIMVEKGWDWVDDNLTFRCDLKFEGYRVNGEEHVGMHWYCSDDDVAFAVDELERILENE